MCVSYSRLLQLTSDLGNGVCDQFALDGVVCPPKMRSGLFTVAAAENIDYNPSTAIAENIYLHRRPGALKTYHQLKKCSNNTSNELDTSPFAGRRP